MKKNLFLSILLMTIAFLLSSTKQASSCSDAGTAFATKDSICYEDTVIVSVTGYIGTVFQWQSNDGTGWINESGTTDAYTVVPGASKQFRAIVTEIGCPSDTSNILTIEVGAIPVPVGIGGSRCGFGQVSLTGTGAAGGNLKWYTTPSGGTAVGSGSPFTPLVGVTTTFYLEDNSSTGGGGGSNQVSPILITELDFNDNPSGGAGDDIEIQNVGPYPVDVTGWKVVVGDVPADINQYNSIINTLSGVMQPGDIISYTDVAGSNYWGQNLFWNNGQNSWVMLLDSNYVVKDVVVTDWDSITASTMAPVINALTITVGSHWVGAGVASAAAGIGEGVVRNGNSDNNNNTDFNTGTLTVNTTNPTMTLPFLGLGCSSPRVPVIATISSSTPATISASATALCLGTSSTLNAVSINGSYTYTWSPAAGLNTTTGTTVIATPLVPTTYTLVATDGTCGAIDSVFIDVGPNSVAGTATATADTVCSSSNAFLSLTGYTGNIQWQSNNGGGWVNETGTGSTSSSYQINPTQSASYQAVVTSGGCPSVTTNTLSIGVITVTSPVTTNDTLCNAGLANLAASGTGILNWYDAQTGGNLVNTGTTYSPNVVAPTTYYVEAVDGNGRKHVGPPNRGFGSQLTTNFSDYGLTFDVTKEATIDSVLMYPSTSLSGSVTINLRNNSGVIINTSTINYPANSFVLRVALGFTVTVGTGYQLELGSGTGNYYYNSTNAVYPYTTVSCPLTITGYCNPTPQTGGFYYYFYDWVVSDGCSSTRTPVSVIFSGTQPQPTITAAGSLLTSSVAINYQWYFNGTVIAGATSQSYNATQPGAYTVAVADAGSSGCLTFSDPFVITGIASVATKESSIRVFPNPSRDKFYVQFGKEIKGNAQLRIENAMGQMVYEKEYTTPAGQQLSIENKLAKGTYQLIIKTNSAVYRTAVVRW
jgi:Ig-like domain CHU_C associated/Secretion system C-terminal sorting domain